MSDSLVGITEWMDDPSKRTEIYTAFINQAILEDVDRERLKSERGFTDEIIDLCHFVSCRPENRALVEDLKNQFSEEELLDSGLLEAKDDGIQVCTQLLGIYNKKGEFVNNICIPYFDQDGEIFYIRPHKYGLKGKGINIYCPARELSPDRTWIITESEFKAAATVQFGFPAIGLPGIHSFVGKSGVNFERLKQFIESLGISKIVVIYDNEIKNNPDFSNYKADVLKQWDTQWRAIDIARKLLRGIPDLASVRIGTLPDAWMEDGKIDIDGALAQGRSESDFRSVVYRAVEWEDYLTKQPNIAKKIITRKIYKEDYLDKSTVRKKETGYFMVRSKKMGRDQEPLLYEEQVSNFTMEIRKTLVEGTTHIREIIFRGQDGSISKPHICNRGTNILRDFKSWVWSCGDYHFTGKQEDLDLIWQLEGAMCDGREIQRPEMIGLLKDEEEPVWLFSNALVKEDSDEFLLPDDEGIIWDGLTGYLPQSIKQVGKSKGVNKTTQIPTISLDPDFGHGELKDVFNKMEKIWGTKAVHLAIGWIVSCLLSDEIHRKYGCFPLLFIAGKRESGKTTLAQWLLAMAGQHDTAGNSLEGASQPAAIRHLAWYSSLPYWQDEYRNNSKVKKWDGFYRNAYNRQSTARGTLGAGVRSPGINAGIILSGEETPQDNALMSRCVVIPLVKNKDKDRNVEFYREIENYRSQGLLSKVITEVLKVKRKILPQILEKIDGWKKRLLAEGVGDRISLNYVIPAVCYDTMFLANEDIETRKEFLKWVVEESHRTELEKESEHMLSIFMDDLVTLHERLEDFYSVYTQNKEDRGKRRMAIHFPSFYSIWTESYRRKGFEQFKRGTMLSYIREEPYYITEKLKRLNGKPTRCVILSLDDEHNPPDGLKYLADGRAESEESIPSAIDSLEDGTDLF